MNRLNEIKEEDRKDVVTMCFEIFKGCSLILSDLHFVQGDFILKTKLLKI